MPREKSLLKRVLAHESIDYSNYSLSQLQETIEKLVAKVEERKPRKVVQAKNIPNLNKIKKAVQKLNIEINKL
ncbi:MAG: hypothetical protein K2G09_08620 [Paramuribaculum sp.]|nr:hypothetical protein [Paramuribaculum sp.]